jgi:hypothetical protein
MTAATALLTAGLSSLRRLGLALMVVGLAVLAVVAAAPPATSGPATPHLVLEVSSSAVPQH